MFVISMVASTVVEGVDAPLVWENVRVDRTAIMAVAQKGEKETRVLNERNNRRKHTVRLSEGCVMK
jgi:hypothetical protein